MRVGSGWEVRLKADRFAVRCVLQDHLDGSCFFAQGRERSGQAKLTLDLGDPLPRPMTLRPSTANHYFDDGQCVNGVRRHRSRCVQAAPLDGFDG